MNKPQNDLFGPAPQVPPSLPGDEVKGRARGGKARAERLSAERRAEIARNAATARWSVTEPPEAASGRAPTAALVVLEYAPEGSGNAITLGFDATRQGLWATQQQIADLFGVDRSVINRHLKNIYESNELVKDETCAFIAQVRQEGGKTVTRNIEHFNLDAILSVGYRVNSRVATHFRRWATQTLRTYVEQGYVLNDKVLREHPEKLNKLAAEVRALRSSEKHIYAKVRECFRISASDYDASSQPVRLFYALLQDKFHHAVTGMTSSKLILERADHLEDNMGLQTVAGDMPTVAEVQIGKNYLRSDELYRLHLLCEQFLLFAESTALAARSMTMESLHEQLDRLLTLNNYPVFDGYQDYMRDEASEHAKRELRMYKRKSKIEALGYEYSPEAMDDGEHEISFDDEEVDELDSAPRPIDDDDY